MTTTRGSAVTGWGTAFPATTVTNADLSEILDTNDRWISERTGIRERRVACGPFAPGSDASSPPGGLGTTGRLALAAGRRALGAAQLDPQDIDLLILCTMSPDQTMPATSAAVQAALGVRCGAFDINAACAGFVYGLVTATAIVASGVDRILLIGADTMSRLVDWEDRSTAVLFGDGAGALVVEAVPGGSALLGWDLGTDGALQPILYADHGRGIKMVGKEVFRRAIRATVESSEAAMEHAKIGPEDVALFVPHQANVRIIEAACARLDIPLERTAVNLSRTGNTGSASVPLVLAEAAGAGRIADGDLVLMSGFGAGMTWASAVWRWGDGILPRQPLPPT